MTPGTTELALHHLQQGRPQATLDVLANAAAEATDPHVHLLRAAALLALDRPAEAERAAEASLADGPHAPGLATLAEARRRSGRDGAAEQALLDALGLAPEDADLLCSYALLMAEHGEIDKARRLVDRARRTASGAEVHRTAASIEVLAGDDMASRGHIDAALAADPLDVRTRLVHSQVALLTGDVRTASVAAGSVAADRPADPGIVAAARAQRVLAHPLARPLVWIDRVGGARIWIGSIVVIFVLQALDLRGAAGVFAFVYLAVAAYSWVAPFVVKRRLRRLGIDP